ncbi:MAG: hypothetical protein P8J68_10230 [Arenicellaceae bacterium]|nr:hypothetical protein [Arenicellaceae bacterium]
MTFIPKIFALSIEVVLTIGVSSLAHSDAEKIAELSESIQKYATAQN